MDEQSKDLEIPIRERLRQVLFSRAFWNVFLRTMPFVPAPEMVDLLEELRRSRTSLDEKVAKAHESLQETMHLIGDLEATVKASSERLSFLRTEYERYSKLAEVEEEKAKAVIQQVERAVRRGKGQERVERLLISIAAGLIVFVLGVIFGPLVRALLGFT